MSKVITITLSDEKYKEHRVEVSEILDYAVYLEADVTIRDDTKYTVNDLGPRADSALRNAFQGTRFTEPV